ncbi:MAG: cytochrome C oxidase subunit II [Pseudomonadota bacterium]
MTLASGPDHGASAATAARVERRWAALSIAIVALMICVAAFSGLHYAVMPQARVETVNPATLHISGEFIESNLGSVLEPNGSVTVRAVGQQFSFTPECIVVPADTLVTFRATSADVVHGFLIEGTNVNTMLVPAYVSVIQTRFDRPGEHAMPCQEFCGIGHQGMWGRVKVVDKGTFLDLASKRKRVTCAN